MLNVTKTRKYPEGKFTDDDPLARVEIGPNMDSHLVRSVSKVDEFPLSVSKVDEFPLSV